jgi:hypothetical protein
VNIIGAEREETKKSKGKRGKRKGGAVKKVVKSN